MSGTDEAVPTTTKRFFVVTLFTAAGAFIAVWSRFEFVGEDLLVPLGLDPGERPEECARPCDRPTTDQERRRIARVVAVADCEQHRRRRTA